MLLLELFWSLPHHFPWVDLLWWEVEKLEQIVYQFVGYV